MKLSNCKILPRVFLSKAMMMDPAMAITASTLYSLAGAVFNTVVLLRDSEDGLSILEVGVAHCV